MKNTPEINFKPVLATDRLVSAEPSHTTRCHNLRPDPQMSDWLTPVNPPAPTSAPQLRLVSRMPQELDQIRLMVTTHPNPIGADIPPITLKGDYTHCRGSLDPTDSRTLTDALLKAYDQIIQQTPFHRTLLHPRLAAWRIVDAKGNVMACSVPMLVCIDDHPFTMVEPLSMSLTKDEHGNFNQLSGLHLSTTSYMLSLYLPEIKSIDVNLSLTADRLEVLVTPPLFPLDLKALASTRLTAQDSAHATLTAYMPGTADGMSPLSAQRRSIIENALLHFHSIARVAYSIPGPFNQAWPGTRPIPLSDCDYLTDTLTARSPQLTAPITRTRDHIMARCLPPNSFAAGTKLSAGDTMIMADITPQRFAGYIPDRYALKTESKMGVRQLTKTEFAHTGETLVAHSADSWGSIPTHLSPLIVSPHPDATSITLRVNAINEPVHELTVELTSTPCGRYSYFLASDLEAQPLTPIDDDYVIPAQTLVDTPLPCTILAAPIDNPGSVTAHCTVGSGSIRRITRAVGSDSAWDFARLHLIVWATDGIYSLSANSSRTTLNATLLHPFGVLRPDAVAPTPWAIFGALADGSVCSVTGSRIRPVLRTGTACAIGYDPTYHELWIKQLTHPDTLVMPLPACIGHYTRSAPVIESFFYDTGPQLLAVGTDGNIYNLSAQPPSSDPIHIEYLARLPSPIPPTHRLSLLYALMQSPHASLTMSVRHDSGAGPPDTYPIVSLAVDGAINAPITARLATRPLPWISVAISGPCHPSTGIGPIALYGRN